MYFYALLTAKNMALFVSSDVLQAVFCNCFCRHTSRTVDSPKSILSGTRAKKKKKGIVTLSRTKAAVFQTFKQDGVNNRKHFRLFVQ